MYLAVGSWRELHGHFPTIDPFLYSIPGEPLYWHHHWLGAQIFFWIEKFFTLDGVIYFKAAMATLLPLMALWQMRRNENRQAFGYFLILLALMISSYRFIARTSLFSDLLTCLILCIGLHERNQKPKWMWTFPLLMGLWINLHPGFPLGIALIGFFWLFDKESFQQKIKSKKLAILALSLLALFANPEGLHGLLYPFLFSAKQGQVYKQFYFEWLPAYSELYRKTNEVLGFFLLSLIGLGVVFVKKVRDSRFLLFLVFIFLGLSAVRFLNLASFALVILTLDVRLDLSKKWNSPWLSRFVAAGLLGLIIKVSFWGYHTPSGQRHLATGIDANLFPIKLAEAFEQGHLHGPIYNSHTFGDYLAWRWGGNPPVFFHGAVLNTDFYLDDYRRVVASPQDFDRLENKYHWTALLVSRYENPQPFFQILSKKSEWRQGAEDASGFLFFKISEPQPATN